MEEFSGNPIECLNFIQSPIDDKGFKANQCIRNAVIAAKNNGDKVVEGILMILVDNKVDSIVIHCWNKHGDSYYDVTKDFVWNSKGWIKKNENHYSSSSIVSYKYLACKEFNSEEHDEDSFKMSYSMLIDYIKSKIKESSLL